MIVGPIRYWWGNKPRRFRRGKRPAWNSPEHLIYVAWREYLSQYLWKRTGYTSYRADKAIKGPWDERFQAVNDAPLAVAGALVNLCPPGIPSDGISGEIQQAAALEKPVLPAPPPDVRKYPRLVPRPLRQLLWLSAFARAAQAVVVDLDRLELFRPAVMQAQVLHTLIVKPDSAYAVPALIETYRDNDIRVHYRSRSGAQVDTSADIKVDDLGLFIPGVGHINFTDIRKIEVLGSH